MTTRRKRLFGVGAATMVACGLWASAIQSQAIQCGGSFVPNLSCTIPGFWNFTRVDPTTSLPLPFQASGLPVTGLVSRTLDLNNAQVIALGGTPITVLAAPGAGYFYDIVAVDLAFNYTAAYTGGSNLKLFYGARTSGAAASSTITVSGFIVSVTADAVLHVAGTPDGTGPTASNAAIVLQGTTPVNFGGGNAANSLRVVVWYRRVATGL